MNQNIPTHVAIIMDGNGRWAQARGEKRQAGHLEGSKTLEKIAVHAIRKGIKVMSVFAFSTDNFKRSQEEVDYLMDLIVTSFKTKMKKIQKEGIKIIFSGRKSPLRKDVLDAMEEIKEKTKNNTNGILNICINYGGQEEMIDAAKELATLYKEDKITIEDLNRDNFYKYLYQDLPPIDLLIRTSGEQRLSNFMLYQASYAELYFAKVHFPDFLESELDQAITEYQKRNRRFGSV